jgi:hypothetical protein
MPVPFVCLLYTEVSLSEGPTDTDDPENAAEAAIKTRVYRDVGVRRPSIRAFRVVPCAMYSQLRYAA